MARIHEDCEYRKKLLFCCVLLLGVKFLLLGLNVSKTIICMLFLLFNIGVLPNRAFSGANIHICFVAFLRLVGFQLVGVEPNKRDALLHLRVSEHHFIFH